MADRFRPLTKYEMNLMYNLRNHPRKEIKDAIKKFNYDRDADILELYKEFQLSEDYGNNDEKFANWLRDMK